MNSFLIPPMSADEFRAFRDLVYRESGIHLSDQKRELLTARLARRLRTLGLERFQEYFRVVEQHRAEREEMLDRIVTNETKFFREPVQFEFLKKAVLPRWKAAADRRSRNRHIRVWSAGCSTGPEPYSLAMILLAELPGWGVEIVASDISRRALRQAAEAIWPVEKAGEIPQPYLEKFMLRGVRTQQGSMRAGDAIRSTIRFRRINLNEQLPSDLGHFDLVLCRNVLIYFDASSRERAIQRLIHHLRDDAFLLLGHSESLVNSSHGLRTVAPCVYTRRTAQHD